MTSRERLCMAMLGGEPDRVPVGPHGWGHVDPDSAVGAEMLARLDMMLPVGGGSSPFWSAGVVMHTVRDADSAVTTLDTPAGELRQVWRRTSITQAVTEHFCKTADQLQAVIELPYEPAAPSLDDYHRWCQRVGDEALIMVGVGDGICHIADLCSPEDLCLLWADAPDLMLAAVNTAHQRTLAWVEACCRAGAKAFRIIGGEYATTQLGPRGFEALCVAQDRELCALMRSYGAISYYHNHGTTMAFTSQFARIAMDALDPLEGPPYGDADLARCRAEMPAVCMVGNLDDMEQIEAWDHDRLRTLAAERLAQAGRRAFVLGGTASGTYTEAGARGFMALLDVVG